jgi:Flp pilus assembly pilin Flp
MLILWEGLARAWAGVRTRLLGEDGAVATEYALLLTLIALAIVLAATALGTAIADKFQAGADCINNLPNPSC